jgi:hypothetical protein
MDTVQSININYSSNLVVIYRTSNVTLLGTAAMGMPQGLESSFDVDE